MQDSPEAQALIALMHRQYEDIRAIESAFQIMGAEGDFRPRIEYYHDAVRMITQGSAHPEFHNRLSVERLSYDVAMLRHIQANPLHGGRGEQHFSVRTDVALPDTPSMSGRPDRDTRHNLAQCYKDYSVLFTALFAQQAEQDAQTRTESMHEAMDEAHKVEHWLNQLASGAITLEQFMRGIDQLEQDELHNVLKQAMQQGGKNKEMMSRLKTLLGNVRTRAAQNIAMLNQASTRYAMDRFAVYEQSQDTLKRLGQQGMNLAGKFVENALRQFQGRGRGV